MRGRHASLVGLAIFWAGGGLAEAGSSELVARLGATVQPAGPRPGRNGQSYLNVEGKANGKEGAYACFGVLEFAPPRPEVAPGEISGVTLTFVQSVPAFSKDGPIAFYLVDEPTPLEAPGSPLKFDNGSDDGLGSQFPSRKALGKGQFKKVKTGQVDAYRLTLDGPTRAALKARLARGEPIRLVVAPETPEVAATFFGPGQEDAATRPKLTIETTP